MWQVHKPLPKEINRPHYDVTRPNKQQQFDLLYLPYNVFEGNTCKFLITGVDVASSHKVSRKRKQERFYLYWKQYIKMGSCL